MSRIAYFAESLNPKESIEAQINWETVQSLAESQHEVKVITTYDDKELPQFHKRVEVIRPFRNWSFFEVMKLAPHLMQYNPDVLHFAQSPRSNKWLKAFKYLATSIKIINNPVVALTYFNVEPDILGSPVKYHHLSYCDIILVPNSLQMQMVSVVPHLPSQQVIEVLTPTAIQSISEPETTWICEEFQNIVFVPGPVSSHERLQEFFKAVAEQDSDFVFVFVDGFGSCSPFSKNSYLKTLHDYNLRNRVYILDDLSPSQREGIYNSSKWILLSSLNTAGFHVAFELRRSLHLKKPIILNSSQAVFDNHKWHSGSNCIISENNRNSYNELISNQLCDLDLQINIETELQTINEQYLMDAPGNRLSRLYLRARH